MRDGGGGQSSALVEGIEGGIGDYGEPGDVVREQARSGDFRGGVGDFHRGATEAGRGVDVGYGGDGRIDFVADVRRDESVAGGTRVSGDSVLFMAKE